MYMWHDLISQYAHTVVDLYMYIWLILFISFKIKGKYKERVW